MNFFATVLGLFFAAALSTPFACPAQLLQPYRFEHEIKNSEEGFTCISLKKEGLALVRELNRFSNGKRKWQLEILDTTLSTRWSTELELETRLMLVGYEYNPEHLYLLFREGENEFHNFQLVTLGFVEKSIQTNHIKLEVSFRMTHFTVAGKNALFGGYIINEPAVLLYDASSEHPKVLPGLFISDMTLLDVRTNQNQSFNVVLTERKGKENKHLIVRTFDSDGNQLMDDIIAIDSRYAVLTGVTNALERDEMIIVGTYGEGMGKQAIGFYSVIVDPFNEQAITYTDFASLAHFLDNLSPRKSEKIKSKAQQQRALGHLPDYRTYVVPFRIEERANSFYLLAQQYYPTSSLSNSPTGYYNPYAYGYMPYGLSPSMSRNYNSPYLYNNSRTSDVHMTQSLVVELSPQGKIIKDASMKLEDIKQHGLEQVSDFTVVHDSIFLVYKKESEIHYQEEAGDTDEKPLVKSTKIRLLTEHDILRHENENEGETRFWYDHHFYVSGYQTIKDATRLTDQTRRIFYVNRLTVD